MRNLIDVTDEYLKSAVPGDGNIILQSGYYTKNHEEEIQTAEWLRDHFGGDIVLQAENNKTYFGLSADYVWHGHLWELKCIKSIKSLDNALRKALGQIHTNPGGVIIKYDGGDFIYKNCERVIINRIQTSGRAPMEIIFIVRGKLERVVRYD